MCHTCTPVRARPQQRALTKSVFRRAAYPAWVITSAADYDPVGFTATSVVPVSTDPPLVSFSVGKSSAALSVLRHTGWAAAHLLDASQAALATTYAAQSTSAFPDDGSWIFDERGIPEIRDTCARLVLSIRELFDAGDSYVALADVAEGSVGSAFPLLQHRGTYTPTFNPSAI